MTRSRRTLVPVLVLIAGAWFAPGAAASSAPAPPAVLHADGTTSGVVELAWSASPGATSYRVWRGSTPIWTGTSLRFEDTSVSPGGSYAYRVTAIDEGGESVGSPVEPAAVPPLPETSPPSQVGTLSSSLITSSTVKLSWTRATDNRGVIAYLVDDGTRRVGLTEHTTSLTVKNLRSAATYSFSVVALDLAGNRSAPRSIAVSTLPGTLDTTPPSKPQGVKAVPYASDTVEVTWGASGDDVSVAGYLIRRGGTVIADLAVPDGRRFLDRGLAPSTAYAYTVQAYDSAGNLSPVSSTRTATTLEPQQVLIVRGPYVQRVAERSARIAWWTNIPAISTVSYSDGSTTTAVTDPVLRRAHSVLLGDLRPQAPYTYTVSYPTSSLSGTFTTCGGDSARIAAVGDFGGGSSQQKAIGGLMAGYAPNLLISTGDNVYPAGEDRDYDSKLYRPFSAVLANSSFWSATGNHDYYDPGMAGYHANNWLPDNEQWYSFECSGLHVLVLDSEQSFRSNSPQYRFARDDLENAQARWRVVVVHHPPYSSSSNGSSDEELRSTLGPLFERHGVQLVLSGHSHNYERTVPLGGVTYVVTGGGGNGVNSFRIDPPSWSAFRAAEYHYVQIDASADSLELRAVRTDGSLIDAFSVT